ncbi:MAG: hypothetical protein IPH16_10095 [Haliscomenobacter sp.]|nr:hypothetical protein [Haliscomenobacter sp.]MBK8880197.1 hypothetical protein [Haliscomenobacter sp.]
MKGQFVFFYLVLSLGFSACQSTTQPHGEYAFLNDFEGEFGYSPNVVLGVGHSGRAYFLMDETMEFGPTFTQTFKNVYGRPFSKIKYSGYVMMPDPHNMAFLTVQVWDTTEPPLEVVQTEINAADLGANRWKEVSIELPLAGWYAPDRQIRCFVHNPGKQTFFLDDLKVEFIP